jgi:hypothetical protein
MDLHLFFLVIPNVRYCIPVAYTVADNRVIGTNIELGLAYCVSGPGGTTTTSTPVASPTASGTMSALFHVPHSI